MNNVSLATRRYGEGRICIVTDNISGYKTYHGRNQLGFWRKLIEWTGQRFDEEMLTVGLLDNSDLNPYSVLSELHNTKVFNITLQYISVEDISKYDILYISGLPNSVSDEVLQKIELYVRLGGGIAIEFPNRGDENINIISSIDNIYCISSGKPSQDNSSWTFAGVNSYFYYQNIKIGFCSKIEKSSFNSNWDILMSDINVSNDDGSFIGAIEANADIGAEFGMSFISAMDKGIVFLEDGGEYIDNTSFNYVGGKIHSATQFDRIYGIFISDLIIAEEYILKWNQMSWELTEDLNSKVFIFAKSSDNHEALQRVQWSDVLTNSPADISTMAGRYLQFMVVMRCDNNNLIVPRIDKINISYFSSESMVKFFTKAFHLGYRPKHVVLTYNADETDDSIIRFAISGDDSVIASKYQYIEPNKIQYLNGISITSKNIKVMIEIVGTSDTKAQVHEFALMFSGNDAIRVNKEAMVSSSSSSSSSSSLGYSTSSSSSSSLGYSTSSSSSSSLGYSTSSSSSSSDSTGVGIGTMVIGSTFIVG